MKIRKSAKQLLGIAIPISVPPQFEVTMSPRSEMSPSPRFEFLPPSYDSQTSFMFNTSSSMSEHYETSFIPWDLMDKLDLSDSQEEERFMETYSVPLARRASWLFPVSMSFSSIMEDVEKDEMYNDMVNEDKDEEKDDMSVDMVNGFVLALCAPKDAGRKMATRKNGSKPKMKKGNERAENKNFSIPPNHSNPKLPGSSKPRGKKGASAFGYAVGEGFYYYAGFSPSLGKRRSISSVSKTQLPAEQDQHASLNKHIDVTLGQARADGADCADDGCRCNHDEMSRIACLDEEINSEDQDTLHYSGELSRIMMKRLSKKRKRKHVNTRSINALM